ncbi:DUF6302 family protein [Streptomyces sp. NBC_01433]|uniref:DUF6302 family protein n=1 Tax=Streptomyces sp. NBC_01433 TaxID=2903864 RepID=UPI002252C903|nr:DUF6302 family protein [Streptomyces sp. NBC_01433]MCX4681452.1 DUF6302 family protein [Streptomyces sp. NBC_01433]
MGPSRQVPAPRLLPPEQGYDYELWARHLINSELLRGAVAVTLFRAPLLAVPTGATRQGGQLHMVEEVFARQTVAALGGLPGFEKVSHRGPIVEWGDMPPPFCQPALCHQFYGLRDPAGRGEPDCSMVPLARHGGHGPEPGCWPPPFERPSGRISLPRESVPAVAAARP